MSLAARLVRFGVTGVGVTAIHILIAVTLVELSLAAPPLANGVAFVSSACISFLVNARFTFKAHPSGGAFVRFWLVTILCGGLSAAIASFAEARHLDYRLGIAMVVAIVPILSFILHNFWSFRRR